jgi:HEAT repeats
MIDKPNSADSALKDALAGFSSNAASSISAIQKLHSSCPDTFPQAAVQLLVSAEEKSPGLQYLARMPMVGNSLADLLINQRVLSFEAAGAVARKLVLFEPRLDVLLFRRLLVMAKGNPNAVLIPDGLRVLGLVDAISDCSLLGSNLIRFLNHPSDKVRSKAALMLGRSNWNLTRVKSLLASDDGRLRANAVESLWGHSHRDVQKILWNATSDPCGRVVINALLGLCRVGDRKAHSRLAELSETSDPMLRSGAAWAMGETGDLEFGEALEKLMQDENSHVSAMAHKSRKKLRAPEIVVAAQPIAPPADGSSPEEPASNVPSNKPIQRPGWLSGTGRT